MQEYQNIAEIEEPLPQGADIEADADYEAPSADRDTIPEADEHSCGDQNGAEPFLIARFNHENRCLDRAGATKYAQLGIKAEPIFAKLRYLAAVGGMQKPSEVLDSLIIDRDNARKQEILDKVGGDSKLMEELFGAQQLAYQKEIDKMADFKEEEVDFDLKLQNDFVEMQKEFPEFKSLSELPKKVVLISAKENIPFIDAYLRYRHAEQKKIDAAKSHAIAAQAASVGSQRGFGDEGESPAIATMLKAIWG